MEIRGKSKIYHVFLLNSSDDDQPFCPSPESSNKVDG